MGHITRSMAAMVLIVVAAFFFALGIALRIVAVASLTPATLATSRSLTQAGSWLQFTAGVAAVAAVCVAAWELVLRRDLDRAGEVAGLAVGTFVFTIGLLIGAISAGNAAANIVSAVGIGVWGIVVLVHAARLSLAEASPDAQPPEALLWLVAACGLVVLAVGYGFTPEVTNRGTGITAGILQAAGVAMVLAAVSLALTRRLLASHVETVTLAGLALLAAAFVAQAVVAGVVFGPGVTITGLRVGLSLADMVELLAIAVLGVAAWLRISELAAGVTPGQHQEPGPQQPGAAPPWRQ